MSMVVQGMRRIHKQLHEDYDKEKDKRKRLGIAFVIENLERTIEVAKYYGLE